MPLKRCRHIASAWVDLGAIEGVALTLTDGSVLPDGRVVVTAVAEDSTHSYADGPCLGAAIGVLDRDGRVLQLHYLQPNFKTESVHALIDDGVICMTRLNMIRAITVLCIPSSGTAHRAVRLRCSAHFTRPFASSPFDRSSADPCRASTRPHATDQRSKRFWQCPCRIPRKDGKTLPR